VSESEKKYRAFILRAFYSQALDNIQLLDETPHIKIRRSKKPAHLPLPQARSMAAPDADSGKGASVLMTLLTMVLY
jgi:hypothetical protein